MNVCNLLFIAFAFRFEKPTITGSRFSDSYFGKGLRNTQGLRQNRSKIETHDCGGKINSRVHHYFVKRPKLSSCYLTGCSPH